MTIAYIYVKVLEEPLQFTTDEDGKRKDQWQGKGGVYAQISKVLVDMHPVGKQESVFMLTYQNNSNSPCQYIHVSKIRSTI